MVPTFTPQPVPRRPRNRRRTGAAVGSVGGLLAAGLLSAPAGAAPAAPAAPVARSAAAAPAVPAAPTRAVDTGPQVSAAVSAAMDCSAPTDHYIVRTADIILRQGVDGGDVQLWYSPACRAVLTVAVSTATPCTSGFVLKAYVVHNGTVTGSGVCSPGGRKAYTPWVKDAGIQQSGKGALYLDGNLWASGTTGAY